MDFEHRRYWMLRAFLREGFGALQREHGACEHVAPRPFEHVGPWRPPPCPCDGFRSRRQTICSNCFAERLHARRMDTVYARGDTPKVRAMLAEKWRACEHLWTVTVWASDESGRSRPVGLTCSRCNWHVQEPIR